MQLLCHEFLVKNLKIQLPMKQKKVLLYAGAGLLLVVAAVFVLGRKEEKTSLKVKVRRDLFQVIVNSSGELRAKSETKIMGPIGLENLGIYQVKISNLVAEGTTVKKGDFVASLDQTELRNKLSEEMLNLQKKESEFTQSQLDTTLALRDARDELENMKYAVEERQLEKDQSIYEAPATQRQVEISYEKAIKGYQQKQQNYNTKVAQAKAKMQIIQSDLSKAINKIDKLNSLMEQLNILAPEDGMVIYGKEWDGRKKVVGSNINTWQPLVAALPDLSRMETITYINEVDIQKIKAGQRVSIGLDASPGKKLEGRVASVASIGEQKPNSDAKVFEVVIDVLTKDTTLHPAMTTSCEIYSVTYPDALIVPLEAVHADSSRYMVYKQLPEGIVRCEVKVAATNDREAYLGEGVTEDEEVFLSLPDTTGIPTRYLEKNAPTKKTKVDSVQFDIDSAYQKKKNAEKPVAAPQQDIGISSDESGEEDE